MLNIHDFKTEKDYMLALELRDYFAARALQGLLANTQIAKDTVRLKIGGEENQRWHSETAYQFADAMLKARQNG